MSDPRGGRALRTLARVEWRQLTRHPRRSLLLVLMVAVPVAAMVGGATLLRIVEPSADEIRAGVMGAAALRVDLAGRYGSLDSALALLPRVARTERIVLGIESVRVPGVRMRARLVALAPGALGPQGLARGLVRVAHGRPPANPAEVALSPVLMQGLDRAVGDSVTLAYGPVRTITGVVIDPEALDQPLVVRTPAVVEDRAEHQLLVDLTGDSVASVAAALRAAGYPVHTRSQSGGRGATATAVIFLFGSVGFLEASLVIAAAFAVSLRRRQREIGLLGSLGATARGITSAMLVSAVSLGAVGAAFGIALGAGAAACVHRFLDGLNRRANGAFELPAEYAVAAAVLGLIAAALAVLFPARLAARLPIREALGARRPIRVVSRRWLLAGVAIELLAFLLLLVPRGFGWLSGLSVMGGAVFGVLGFGACSPWVLAALARHAGRLPIAWRLALRDSGRFAARNGPVVTAVLAAMAMGVMVAVLVASIDARIMSFPAPYRDDQLVFEGGAAETIARRVAAEHHAVAVAPVSAVYARGIPLRVRFDGDSTAPRRADWVACGDESLLRALDAEAAGEALEAGELLAIGLPSGAAEPRVIGDPGAGPLTWPRVHRVAMSQNVVGPAYVLSSNALEVRGLESGPPPRKALVPWIVRFDRPLSNEVLRAAQALAAASPGTVVDATRLHRAPARAFYFVLLIACMLTALVVVLVATALTAAESAGDEHVLHTVGASPALMRSHAAARAGYLALLGCALAVPAGMLPAIGLISSANFTVDIVIPWRDVALAVCALPVVAYAVTWWFAGGAHSSRTARGRLAAGLVLLGACGMSAGLHATANAVRAPLASAPAIRWERHVGTASDGTPLVGELGRIRVPERRGGSSSRTIELAFVRYRTTHPRPGPPLFVLEGGPGASGIEGCAFVATHPLMRMLEQCDVIGIDQRGTGLSRPDLSGAAFRYALPLDRPLTRDAERAAFTAGVAAAAAHARAQGVDLAAYSTVENADDIDDVRRALGVDTILTYGDSYGTHLSLAYLRRHARHVARAVLAKVEGPDDTWKRPATMQRHLEALGQRAAADPAVRARIPDLAGRVNALLAALARTPVTVRVAYPSQWRTPAAIKKETPSGPTSTAPTPVSPDSVFITLGPYDLQCALAGALATTRGAAGIPRMLDALSRGDWTPLAVIAIERRRADVGSLMGVLMDCASGASPARRDQIRRERADPRNVLGDAIDAPFYPSTCDACGNPDLGAAFRAPLVCDVPLLLVSGDLDARTPPENADALRAGCSRLTQVLVRGAGHDPRELLSEEYRDLLQAFVRGEHVESCTLALPFRFEPFDENLQ